jgi:hypothetical protein
LFSAAHGTFSRIDHILGHKRSLNKFKKIKISPCIVSDHNTIKHSNTWRLNNTLLENQWVTKVIREEIKKFLESNENENTTYQNLWDSANTVLRGKFLAISTYIKMTPLK